MNNSIFLKYLNGVLEDPMIDEMCDRKLSGSVGEHNPYRVIIAGMIAQGILLEQIHEGIAMVEAAVDDLKKGK